MKKGLLLFYISLVVLLVACTPKATPAPATPAPTAPAKAADPISALPTPTTQDAAWAKVVEAAKKEGSVSLYSWGLTGDLGVTISKAFKDKYGINVEMTTGTGAQLVPRIQAEYRSGQYVADILEGSPINAIFAKTEKLTQSFGELPQKASKDVWVRDPFLDKEGHIVSFFYTIHGAYINTNLLNPNDAPKSWKALLEPKWKGKMVVPDPDSMPTANQLYVVLTRQLGFTDDFFRDLAKQDLLIAPTHPEADAVLGRGQASINLASSLSTMAPMIVQGAPIVPIAMTEGVPSPDGSALNLMAKSPHPNASRLFADWLISKEGQELHAKTRSVPSVRKDVADYRPQATRINYTKLAPMSEDDWNEGARVQREKVLSKLGWKR